MKGDFNPVYNSSRIPVTIITGFLGSGKTTFLNHLLKKYGESRFAIIENEFGELGIDKDLLDCDNLPVYELINGCICCTLNEDFFRALQLIIESSHKIDHLLIETTGIADPGQVIDVFLSNEQIKQNFIINSVICLADSANLQSILDNEKEAVKQVVLADIVMLNKIDLIDSQGLGKIKSLIREINPMAQIIETQNAHTNGTPVLKTAAYSHHHVEQSTLSFDYLRISLGKIIHSKSISTSLNNKIHNHDIHAEAFVFDECIDPELFNIWITSYLYFNQKNLYRVKGVLYFKAHNKKYIFQSVKGSCIFEEGNEWKKDEVKFSKLVFIGKFIDREMLENRLEKLFFRYDNTRIVSAG